MHAALHLLPALARQGCVIQAGAVKAVHALQARAHLGYAHCGGVHGQIAALGMPAHIPHLRKARRFLQKSHRLPLRGHRAFKGHVKVLLPANKGRVRAAKGHNARAVASYKQRGGKLLFFLRLKVRGEALERYIAEARAVLHGVP